MKNIVVIGGGTGTYTVLMGLKKHPVNLAAVVSMADDGGSTRVLREEFGVLPPGSVRPALVALSGAERSVAELFNYRFKEGSLKGHSMGNLLITALAEQTGSFKKAVQEAGRILQIQGRVVPSTLESTTLVAELENGEVVRGEGNVDEPSHDTSLKIAKVWLEPEVEANPEAVEAVGEADCVLIGPGDVYSSILPNFLVGGIAEAVRDTGARVVYICNIMTKVGETTGFGCTDFIHAVERFLKGRRVDAVLVNTGVPSPERIAEYEAEGAEFVKPEDSDPRFVKRDLLRSTGFIRHDPDRLASAIMETCRP